jgi:hypothetical protein
VLTNAMKAPEPPKGAEDQEGEKRP